MSSTSAMTKSLDANSEKLTDLQNLLERKNEIIQSLHEDLENEKDTSSNNSLFGDRRASKIKNWVASRLKELESQNEKLRTQNLKCAQQLRLLKTCAENSALWRSRLMTNSLQASLPSTSADRGGLGRPYRNSIHPHCKNINNMTSSAIEWPKIEEQSRTASYERIVLLKERVSRMTTSVTHWKEINKENCCHLSKSANETLVPKSNPASPRPARQACRLTSETRTSSLPRQTTTTTPTSTPRKKFTKHKKKESAEESRKPVPKPRRKEGDSKISTSFSQESTETGVRAILVNSDLLQIERDSLDMDTELEESIHKCSTLEIRDSMCNLMLDRDSLHGDYVNLSEMQMRGFENYKNNITDLESISSVDDAPPKLPEHKQVPPWEKKLHFLAEQCLGGGSGTERQKSFVYDASCNKQSPHTRIGSGDSAKFNKRDSGSNCGSVKTVPMFSTRNNMGVSPTLLTVKSSGPSTSTEPDSSPYPYTSGGSGPGTRSSGDSSSKRIQQIGCHQELSSVRDGVSSSEEDDYAYPPDTCLDDSPVEITDPQLYTDDTKTAEKRGYVTKATDGRMKTWQRRWLVLSQEQLSMHKTKNDENKRPLGRISISDITSIRKTEAKNGHGFQLTTQKSTHNLCVESMAMCDSWIKAIEYAIQECTNETLAKGEGVMDCACSARGWLTKVKFGHSKRCFASLLKCTIIFTKSSQSRLPLSQLNVHGASIQEVVRTSDDSGSDDTSTSAIGHTRPSLHNQKFSICVQLPLQEPVYFIFLSREEKDKWLYHLKLACHDGILYGTPFEILIQRIMTSDDTLKSDLWFDILLTTSEPCLRDPLTTLSDTQSNKEAINLYKSCHLFCSVPIQATIEYHVDLAQTIFKSVMYSDCLKTELFAQLIKLSCCSHSPQICSHAWKLVCLAVSLFTPTQYAILWLLNSHIHRIIKSKTPYLPLAVYCEHAMHRCNQNGPRKEHPSRLELMSLLLKDPTEHNTPHSIPVHLPDNTYQIVGFDGSTTVQECLETICIKQGIRHHLYSGYSLFADDPTELEAPLLSLSPKRKLCDIMSHWEHQWKDCKSGKVSTDKMIRLCIKQRFFWSHLICGETEKERSYCIHRAADDIRKGFIPLSCDLAEEVCALLCQIHLGDYDPSKYHQSFEEILQRFYPVRLLMVSCKKTLHFKLEERWRDMKGMVTGDCCRVLLGVLRKWHLFGAEMYLAKMKWKADESVYISLSETGIHLMKQVTMAPIATYPYQNIVNFGGFRDDFIVTLNRGNPLDEEPTRERLVFSMAKKNTLALTMHIADYIRARRLVWYPRNSGTPRKHEILSPRR